MSDNTDLRIGQKYGIWTIIEDTGKLTRYVEKIYKALSDYGRERVVWRSHIEYGGPGYPVNVLNNQTNLERKRVKKKIHKRKVPICTTAITREKLEELYYVQNKSCQDIANEYNCSDMTVRRLMDKYGLRRRKRSEARKFAIREGKFKDLEYYDIDEKFFSKWSPEMAWVLGLLFTDGNVSNAGVVTLTSVDLELLEKVKHHLKSTQSITKRAQSYDKSKYIYILQFGREKMTEDLDKLGLIQRKSLIMEFPDIPEQYVRHFIRGCWDGDGSVYYEKRRPREIRASYTCGSKQFIKRIVLELHKIGIERLRISHTKRIELGLLENAIAIYEYKGRKGYYIRLAGKNCQRLFHYFYDEVDESLYLKRKYEVFKKGIDLLKNKSALLRN